MTVTACDSLADLKAALDSAGNKLVVIDFFATWCGPCRLISPAIQGWAAEMADVVFIKVDVDKNAEAAEEYDISAMPTFKLIKKGEVHTTTPMLNQIIETVVGASQEHLEAAIAKNK